MVEMSKGNQNVIEVDPLVSINDDGNTIAEIDATPQLATYQPQFEPKLPYTNNIENWLWLLGAAAFALLIYGLASD